MKDRTPHTSPTKDCGAAGCGRPLVASGWCMMHYKRVRKWGRPEGRPTPLERFWSFVSKTDDCWIWTGSTNPGGYGKFRADNTRHVTAHRFSYELRHGPVEGYLFIMHRCDNRRCVNPAHLTLGTHLDNMADMASKGRARNRYTGPIGVLDSN